MEKQIPSTPGRLPRGMVYNPPISRGHIARRSRASGAQRASTGAADSVPVTPMLRNPRLRILLLLLMMVMLGSVAIWTPKELQAVAASTMELLLSTDVAEYRTAPGVAPLVGQLDVTSSPSGLELLVDGEGQGVTRKLLVLHAGTHELTLVSPVGTVSRQVRIRPSRLTRYSEAIFSDSLEISPETEREVWVDGQAVVRSDAGELLLAPGIHRIDLVNPDDGARTRHTVEIFPGRVSTLDLTPDEPGA